VADRRSGGWMQDRAFSICDPLRYRVVQYKINSGESCPNSDAVTRRNRGKDSTCLAVFLRVGLDVVCAYLNRTCTPCDLPVTSTVHCSASQTSQLYIPASSSTALCRIPPKNLIYIHGKAYKLSASHTILSIISQVTTTSPPPGTGNQTPKPTPLCSSVMSQG
jgi:hypothetical protein